MAMTTALGALAVAALVAVGCTSPPEPARPNPGYEVVARWAADDGSVVALNVVVGPGLGRGGLGDVAQELRQRDPGSRVIVAFYAEWAGPERYVLGHVPAGREPLALTSHPPSWLWTVDLRPDVPPPL